MLAPHLPGKGTGSLLIASNAGVPGTPRSTRALRDGAPSSGRHRLLGGRGHLRPEIVGQAGTAACTKARRVITLELVPFHGTELASAWPWRSCLQRLPDGVAGAAWCRAAACSPGWTRPPMPTAAALALSLWTTDDQTGYPMPDLRPAGQVALKRAHRVGVPGCAGQPLLEKLPDQPGGHRDGPAGARFRPGPGLDSVGLRWLWPHGLAARPRASCPSARRPIAIQVPLVPNGWIAYPGAGSISTAAMFMISGWPLQRRPRGPGPSPAGRAPRQHLHRPRPHPRIGPDADPAARRRRPPTALRVPARAAATPQEAPPRPVPRDLPGQFPVR